MRSLVLIGLLVVQIPPLFAAEKMTVAQFEQMIAQNRMQPLQPSKKQPNHAPDEITLNLTDADFLHQLDQDDDLVRQMEAVELSERMSTLTLYRLVGKYDLGIRAQQALEELADRSALLKLPSSEQLHQPPPDQVAQSKMLAESRNYVVSELSHLSNFIATQTTTRYDNSPLALKNSQSMIDGAGFHRVGGVKRQITFRDGKEVVDESHQSPDSNPKASGLESRGEFGTEAAVVLMDLKEGNAVFDHWEQTMGGPAAVYRYTVPREFSHYEVTDQCREQVSFHDTPGYQGELALDPNSGALMRMTLEVDSRPGDPVSHVASVVEYGPVVLGNHRSICPLRSLTFMVEEVYGCGRGKQKLEKPVAMVNQTIFSNYHRFGSSATMILHEPEGAHASPGSLPVKPTAGGKGLPASPADSGQNRRP